MKIVIVFPLHNEAEILEKALDYALQVLPNIIDIEWRIIVVENGSTDNSVNLLKKYAEHRAVKVLSSPLAAKGSAIKFGWLSEQADVYCFSDIDQSIDLAEVLPQIVRYIRDGAEVVTCVRDQKTRPLTRRLTSRGYRFLAKLIMGTKLNDLPCGMKAITHEVKKEILPKVKEESWFFDSELLLRAEAANLKIIEIPATWVENRFLNRKQRLPMLKISWQYIRALIRLRATLR
jgi:glycosyltransferase involved in cell wall biosynthesis